MGGLMGGWGSRASSGRVTPPSITSTHKSPYHLIPATLFLYLYHSLYH